MRILKILLVLLLICSGFTSIAQTTFTVNSAGDDPDRFRGDGICETFNGECTLRAAIEEANWNSQLDSIIFENSIEEIVVSNGLPAIINPVAIDGGSTGQVRLSRPSGDLFEIASSDVSLFGLHIDNCDQEGVNVNASNISNLRIGAANKGCIFTNNQYGLFVSRQLDGLLIEGSYFGTDLNFSPGLGNEQGDIDLNGSSGTSISNVVIGGDYDSPESNYFASNTSLAIGLSFYSSDVSIQGNYFGSNKDKSIILGGHAWISLQHGVVGGSELKKNYFINAESLVLSVTNGSQSGPGSVVLSHNEIVNNNLVANVTGELKATQNMMSCNVRLILGNNIDEPVISYANDKLIQGTATSSSFVDVYLSDTTNCVNSICQPTYYLGTANVDAQDNWSLSSSVSLGYRANDGLVAISRDISGVTSHVSDCYIVLPDNCFLSNAIPVNSDPCSAVGAVVDMTQLGSTNVSINNECADSYLGNDAWFKVTIPESGNVVLRANIENSINTAVQVYSGSCNNLNLIECAILDASPYVILLEDYAPGNIIYVRAWDKFNASFAGLSSILHLTAHHLSSDKKDWFLCDFETGASQNPSIIGVREANSMIMNYEENASINDIIESSNDLIEDGLVLIDECSCGSNPVQLWEADNPDILEGLKRTSRPKAKIDTTNYNYIFENLEFQVNSIATGNQHSPHVDMNANGDFVMVWSDGQRRRSYGRLYSSSGNPLTPEFRLGNKDLYQFGSTVQFLSTDSFVASWVQEEGSGFVVASRVFYWANGTLTFDEVNKVGKKVADLNSGFKSTESKALSSLDVLSYSLANGDIVYVWQTPDVIFIQKVRDLELLGTPTVISKTSSFLQSSPIDSDMNTSGELLVAWETIDSLGNSIYFQKFDTNSESVFIRKIPGAAPFEDENEPTVILNQDGTSIVAWSSRVDFPDTTNFDVFVQLYDTMGDQLGSPVRANSFLENDQRDPELVGFADNSFFLSWSSFGQDGFEEGIFGQYYNADGSSIGQEIQLNQLSFPEQENPTSSSNGEDLFIVAWEDGANDGSFKGIFAQRYEVFDNNGTKEYFPLSTTTPSKLLGQSLSYSGNHYQTTDNASIVRVAIVDTGIDPNHPALKDAIWNNNQVSDPDDCIIGDILGYDFVNEDTTPEDNDGHGTQVAGIIAKDFDNSIKLELMNLKFSDRGRGSVFDAICAIYYAVDNGADIINLSWGFEASEVPQILEDALTYAADNDVLVVTSAGNTSKNLDNVNKYPADLDISNMIVVTSYHVDKLTQDVALSNYASYGHAAVDIAAHGFVETTGLNNGLVLAAGTSLATPSVTRTAATIKGLFPALSSSDITTCILSSVTVLDTLNALVSTGGILDHQNAINCARAKAENCLGIDVNVDDLLPFQRDSVYKTLAWISSSKTTVYDNTLFLAKDHISLKSGFSVNTNHEFIADISDCSITSGLRNMISDRSASAYIAPHSSLKKKLLLFFKAKQSTTSKLSVFRESESDPLALFNMKSEKQKWKEKIVDFSAFEAGSYILQFNNGDITESIKVEIE